MTLLMTAFEALSLSEAGRPPIVIIPTSYPLPEARSPDISLVLIVPFAYTPSLT